MDSKYKTFEHDSFPTFPSTKIKSIPITTALNSISLEPRQLHSIPRSQLKRSIPLTFTLPSPHLTINLSVLTTQSHQSHTPHHRRKIGKEHNLSTKKTLSFVNRPQTNHTPYNRRIQKSIHHHPPIPYYFFPPHNSVTRSPPLQNLYSTI